MTWSFYTDFLDGSRPITHEERDELYDKLQELLTEVCPNGNSLDEDEMDDIKGSTMLTDRAVLAAGPLIGSLHEILEAVSGDYTNYGDAEADALAAEGLTEARRDDLADSAVSRPDDHRLWNYYRRMIDTLECEEPPCFFDEASSGDGDFEDAYEVTEFGVEREVVFSFLAGEHGGTPPTVRVKVYADGVAIYDSGCLVEPDITENLTVPAGTTEIVVEMVTCTGPADTEWFYDIFCV